MMTRRGLFATAVLLCLWWRPKVERAEGALLSQKGGLLNSGRHMWFRALEGASLKQVAALVGIPAGSEAWLEIGRSGRPIPKSDWPTIRPLAGERITIWWAEIVPGSTTEWVLIADVDIIRLSEAKSAFDVLEEGRPTC